MPMLTAPNSEYKPANGVSACHKKGISAHPADSSQTKLYHLSVPEEEAKNGPIGAWWRTGGKLRKTPFCCHVGDHRVPSLCPPFCGSAAVRLARMQHAKPIGGVLRPERLPKFGMPPNSEPPVSLFLHFSDNLDRLPGTLLPS